MPHLRGPGRLFWKVILVIWLAMMMSIPATVYFYRLQGGINPPWKSLGLSVPLAARTISTLLAGALLAWYLLRPLRHLRWALKRLAEGHFDTRVQPLMGHRRDEITDLAKDIDRTAEQLQRLTDARQNLLHDISHELRSPLTRLQATIGLLRQDPSQVSVLLERIERESERLDALIGELLTLHRIESGSVGERRSRLDVMDLLHAIAEDADFEARACGRAVVIIAPSSFVTEVNGELIYRAFENVIRNAVKYTAPGSTVEICARLLDGEATLEITVQDRGPGVPPDMLEAIFEPFIRVEGSESIRGAGLGLAIAKRAILVHGGRINAESRERGGLTVRITLPAS